VSTGATAAFATLAFVVVFPAFWILVTSAIAEMGGWNRLQRAHPDNSSAVLYKRLSMRSANLGHPYFGVSYSACLTFDVCDTGLRISVWKIFGVFTKPVFLKWEDFKTELFQWFIWKGCRLRWGSDAGDTIFIYRRNARAISTASLGAFELPEPQ